MKLELGIHPTHLHKIFSGERHPSRRLAINLEKETGIHRLSWLYPEEYFNPQSPHLYQSSWPPDLSHLQGESREWAEAIIRAFPERPPERKEFRKWLKEQRKKGKR